MTTQPTAAVCPNQNLHQWHPTGYLQHHMWANDALLIADQRRCPGCGLLEIWVPKRSNLRLRGTDWTWSTCAGADDAGKPCKREPICERYFPDERTVALGEAGVWSPVCYRHTGLRTVTA